MTRRKTFLLSNRRRTHVVYRKNKYCAFISFSLYPLDCVDRTSSVYNTHERSIYGEPRIQVSITRGINGHRRDVEPCIHQERGGKLSDVKEERWYTESTKILVIPDQSVRSRAVCESCMIRLSRARYVYRVLYPRLQFLSLIDRCRDVHLSTAIRFSRAS